MHPHCYYFTIALAGEGGRSSDNDSGGNVNAASYPRRFVWEGGGGYQLRETLLLLRVPDGRSTYLTLGAHLTLADDNGDGENGRGRGGVDEDESEAA